jgi:hypothetical protein
VEQLMQVHMLTKEVKPGVFPLPLGVYFIGFPFGAPLEVLFVFGFFFFQEYSASTYML